ncbi:MAG TPA: SDR family oxidoreductase [Terriglobia bacterium]|nr:SDR family oxidoreductase [Terriglobia bacterium]
MPPGPGPSVAQPHLFCFGLGYSATALADSLLQRGWKVSGTCRTAEKATRLAARGITAHLFDRDRPVAELARHLQGVTHLLSSVPPDAAGDPVIDLHGAVLRQQKNFAWTGYLSTTGVYGDRQGGWVDEESALQPSGERGRRRLAAEKAWLELTPPAHLFRLAGIYGPGSSALDTVRAGRARNIVKPGQVFSRIHVADIVQVLLASIARPHPGRAYNVCDDDAAPPADVVLYACRLLGIEPPPPIPFDQAELSPMARSFYDDNKRVHNDRIKQELGVSLLYPDYRAGLAAILAAEQAPPA